MTMMVNFVFMYSPVWMGQPNPAKSGDGGELTQAEDVSDYIFSLRGRKHEHWHPRVRRC
jgi:hypothetical protein